MLTEICQYLHNYFEYEKLFGDVIVTASSVSVNGKIVALEEGQYFALFRGRIPLGVFKNGDTLKPRHFEGAVWLLDIPDAILNADTWAESWKAKNGAADSDANSAFTSESFGGYSYSKGTTSTGKAGSGIFDNAQFSSMLAPYRKLP